MTIEYLSEEDHVERMAKAIYLSHNRRVTLIVAWERLPIERREAFKALAAITIDCCDKLREAWRK